MLTDRQPPSQLRAAQLRALGRYTREHVYPYSSFYRSLFGDARLPREASGADVLRALPTTALSDVDDPATLVLRPDEQSIQRFGHDRP